MNATESSYSFTIDLLYVHLIQMFEFYFLTNYELPIKVLNTRKFSDSLTPSFHETGEETGTQRAESPSTKATRLVERSWPDVLMPRPRFNPIHYIGFPSRKQFLVWEI